MDAPSSTVCCAGVTIAVGATEVSDKKQNIYKINFKFYLSH